MDIRNDLFRIEVVTTDIECIGYFSIDQLPLLFELLKDKKGY